MTGMLSGVCVPACLVRQKVLEDPPLVSSSIFLASVHVISDSLKGGRILTP